jgi:hypothetical protein
MKALSFAAQGVQGGQIKLDDLAWPLSLAEKTLGDVLSDRHATFSWQELTQGRAQKAAQLGHFLEIDRRQLRGCIGSQLRGILERVLPCFSRR